MTAPGLAARLQALPPGLAALGAGLLTTGLWTALQRVEPFLGHDESVYALRGRAWLTGAPATGWQEYRPVGLPALAYAALRARAPLGSGPGDTAVVRLVGLGLALLTLAIVYAVGARVTTPRRAAVSVLVVISGATFLRRLPEFLDDLPAAGLLMLVAYLVLRSRRPAGSWALPAAAAVAVPALLVRYGAAAGLLSITLAAVAVWGPRSWLLSWRQVTSAVAVLAAGLAPLAVHSQRVTGSWTGVLVRSEQVAHRAYLGEGLVYYARAFPYKLAGVVGAVVICAALLSLPRCCLRCWRPRPGEPAATTTDDDAGRRRDREWAFLGLAALGELLLLGLVAHGESRFALFTVLTLTVLGVDAIATAAGSRRRAALTVTAVAALLATAVTYPLIARQITDATARLAAVDRALGGVPAGSPAGADRCLVVAELPIEASWASGCAGLDPAHVRVLPTDAAVYLVDLAPPPGDGALQRIRALDPRRSWSERTAGTARLASSPALTTPPG